MNDSIPNQKILSQYISDEHLNSNALQRMSSCFNSSRIGLVEIDNFLLPGIAKHCNQFLTTDAQYGLLHGYTDKKKPTSNRKEWLNAPENQRFFCYEMLETNRNSTLDIQAISFVKLRHFLASNTFKCFVETLIARKLGAVTPVRVHRMQAGHFLKSHSDRGNNREIAFILYLSSDWQHEYGGNLHIIDRENNEVIISPAYNRLLIFDVHQHEHHYLSHITQGTTPSLTSGRISINGWFQKAPIQRS